MRKIIDNSTYNFEYKLIKNWPEDCFIQGGSNGVVISKNGNYKTYYIEAFPKKPKCFIRGEGDSFEEAETQAYNQYIEFSTCKKHEFIKLESYQNGMGKCKHCGLMDTVFEPDYTCIKCKKHECFCFLQKEYMKNKFDCICEECAGKEENLYLLTDYDLETLIMLRRGPFKCILEKNTFNKIIKHLDKNNKKLLLSKKDLFKIIKEYIYLVEYLKRINLNKDIVSFFFESFILEYIDNFQ